MASESSGVSGLAGRYASALFALADEQKCLDQVADDLKQLKALIAESEDLRRMVRSPMLSRDDQMRAMAAVMERAGAATLTANFIGVVAANRRLFALTDMIDGFLAILAERRGEITAEVTAAKALSDGQVDAVIDALRRTVGGKVAVDVKIDPGLLGGLVVKVGSRMVDSSLRTKLQRLQLAMKGVG